jgi:DNA-directed RNA polymerase subunit RPC12/RpoP
MNKTELKPCPFCGGESDFLTQTTTIKCKQCGSAFIVTNPLISRLEVAQAWNRRVDNEQREANNH